MCNRRQKSFLKAVSGSALASIQIRIQILYFWSCVSLSRILMIKNVKVLQLKKFIIFFILKLAMHLSLGLQEERTQTLKREHQALQNNKFLYLLLLLRVTFVHLVPGPDAQLIPISDPDPDPVDHYQCGSMRITYCTTL
jgi:hypothetical protein